MRVAGVIPARWASTRLPGKSLLEIAGKPLIQWVIERASMATRLDSLLVATDDQRIFDAVEKMGAVAVMTRPDHPSGTDRVAEAVGKTNAEVVVNIQGDEPMIDPGLVDRIAGTLADDESWDMATAATPIGEADELQSSSAVKVVFAEDRRALYFSRSPIPFVRDDDLGSGPQVHWRHLGIYGYRTAFLRRLVAAPPWSNTPIKVISWQRTGCPPIRIWVVPRNPEILQTDTAMMCAPFPDATS